MARVLLSEYMQYIPAISRIEAIATYDNTNDFNMGWGELTTDEMFFCPIYYVPYQGDENIYLGINETTGLFDDKISDTNIFPNPAKDQVIINHQFRNQESLKVIIYDNQGRIASIIIDENLKSETNSVKLDISSLSAGLYFINLQSNSEMVTTKFVKE